MPFKYTLILFLGFCTSVFGVITEAEQRRWYDDLGKKYWENCKDIISDDSLQQLNDDMEADNEEIRDFRLCLFIHREYIKMSQINIEALLNDYKKYASQTNNEEIGVATRILKLCKAEAQWERNDKDIVGKFVACVIDRCKSED